MKKKQTEKVFFTKGGCLHHAGLADTMFDPAGRRVKLRGFDPETEKYIFITDEGLEIRIHQEEGFKYIDDTGVQYRRVPVH